MSASHDMTFFEMIEQVVGQRRQVDLRSPPPPEAGIEAHGAGLTPPSAMRIALDPVYYVTPECDTAAEAAAFVVLGIVGWLRDSGPGGTIFWRRRPEIVCEQEFKTMKTICRGRYRATFVPDGR